MICDPGVCDHCIYVGEGDFLCDNTDDEAYVVVMSDWEPRNSTSTHCERERGRGGSVPPLFFLFEKRRGGGGGGGGDVLVFSNATKERQAQRLL